MDCTSPQPDFTILYDGECPFCVREVSWLRKRDRDGRLGTIDISSENFDPRKLGTTREAVMARIHGLDADGNLIEGMEVFRKAYRAAGVGWIMAPTGWPVLRPILDVLYSLFAKVRVPLGRLFGRTCDDGVCAR